jgi:hypothetical protein
MEALVNRISVRQFATYERLWSLYWRCLRHGHLGFAEMLHARLHAFAQR